MKKTLICLLVAMMLALMLPLCASAQDDVVTIKAMWEATRPENEYTEETRQYIREHLGIDLELTQVSENFSQQLALSIAGGLDEFFLKFAHSFCVYLLMFNEHRYNCVK